MKSFIITFVLVSISILTGCPNLGGSHNTQDSYANGDGVSGDVFNTDNVELPPWLFYVTLEVNIPNGLQTVDKIVVANGLENCLATREKSIGCHFTSGSNGKGITSWTILTPTEEKTSFTVALFLKNYMFVENKGFVIGPKTDKKFYKISRDDWKPGEWGLAPQGTYTLENDEKSEVGVTTIDGTTDPSYYEPKIKIETEKLSGTNALAGGYLTSYNTWDSEYGDNVIHVEISDNLLILTETWTKHSDTSFLKKSVYYKKF